MIIIGKNIKQKHKCITQEISRDDLRYSAPPVSGFSSSRTEPDPWLEKYVDQIDYSAILPSIVLNQYTENLSVLTVITISFLLILLIPAAKKEPDNIESLQITSKVGKKLFEHKLLAYCTVLLVSFIVMIIGLFAVCSQFEFHLFFSSDIHSLFAMPNRSFVPLYNPNMNFGQYVALTGLWAFIIVLSVTGTACILASYSKKTINGILICLTGCVESVLLNLMVFYPFLVVPNIISSEYIVNNTYFSYLRHVYEGAEISGTVFSNFAVYQLAVCATLFVLLFILLFVKIRKLKRN